MIKKITFDESGRIPMWTFYEKDCFYTPKECECGSYMSNVYIEIIDRLKDNNLLAQDYKLRCCYCHYIMKNVGFIRCQDCGYYLNVTINIDEYDYDHLKVEKLSRVVLCNCREYFKEEVLKNE